MMKDLKYINKYLSNISNYKPHMNVMKRGSSPFDEIILQGYLWEQSVAPSYNVIVSSYRT